MSRTLSSKLMTAVFATVAALMLGAAPCAAANQSQPVQPTASALLDVPESHVIPGNIKVTPEIKNPVAQDPNAIARGMKYFNNFDCSGCHAANGAGGMGPALSEGNFKFGDSPADIYLTIDHGRPTGMPAWGTVLPSHVIWDLVAYIESISNAPSSEWGTTTSLQAMKIEQVPAEFQPTPHPWKYTEPFGFGQKPSAHEKSGSKTN
jgi:cytochrome c oxidase cbb3-type subunit III